MTPVDVYCSDCEEELAINVGPNYDFEALMNRHETECSEQDIEDEDEDEDGG